MQADIVAELIRANIAVHAFNQRDVAEILAMIRTLVALVCAAEALAAELSTRLKGLARARVQAAVQAARLFRGMGPADDFGHRLRQRFLKSERSEKHAKDRIVSAEQVIAAEPEIVIGLGCGKKFGTDARAARPEFANLSAVKAGWLREIKSTIFCSLVPPR